MRSLWLFSAIYLVQISGQFAATAPRDIENDVTNIFKVEFPDATEKAITLAPIFEVVAPTAEKFATSFIDILTLGPKVTPVMLATEPSSTAPSTTITISQPVVPDQVAVSLKTPPIEEFTSPSKSSTTSPPIASNVTSSLPIDVLGTTVNSSLVEMNSTTILHEALGTKILLYTRKNPQHPVTLLAGDTKAIINLINFDGQAPTRFIVHGSYDGPDSGQWMKDMKNRFLQIEKVNVLIVDWSKSATVSMADQRLQNIRMVGNQVAKVIEDLIEHKKVRSEDVHLVAHSFGTFAADVVGRKIKRLGRISGLDPAGPNFDALPTDMRLDRSDALFVDVIHTDSSNSSVSTISLYGRGTSMNIGHMDFYPNGGADQPGCSLQRFEDLVTRPIGEGIRRFVACPHYRSVDYYLDSITPNDNLCAQLAYPCDNYTDFMDGRCARCDLNVDEDGFGDCAQMGFRSQLFQKYNNRTNAKNMYLNTSRRKPYCLYHYHLEVKVAEKPEVTRGGVLLLRITGEYGMMEARFNGGMAGFKSGNTTSLVTTHHMDIGAVKSLSLAWLPAPSLNLFSDPTVHIEHVTVSPMSLADKGSRKLMTRTLCPIDKPAAVLPFYRESFFATDLC